MSGTAERLCALMGRGIPLGIHAGALYCRDGTQGLTEEEQAFMRERGHEGVLEIMQTTPPSEDAVPLTFQQEFALERCGNAFYGVFTARVSGSLDVDALCRSVRMLYQRHGALRMNLIVSPTGLCQHTGPAHRCDLEVVQLPEAYASESDAALVSYLTDLVGHWLNATRTTFAMRVIRVAREEHVLVVLWDHLFEDFGARLVFFKELWMSYGAALGQNGSALPSAPMQYADYARWQRQTYAGWSQRHVSYWQERLKGAVPLRLPIDAQAGSRQQPAHKAAPIRLDEALTLALRGASQRLGVGMSFVVVALAARVLAVWSGQRRFTLPMTFAGRYHAKHLEIVGYFPNFIPLNIALAEHDTFAELCRAIAKEFLSGVAHLEIGKTMDGGNPELLAGPFVQWYPSGQLPNQPIVSAAPACDTKSLGLVVAPLKGEWNSLLIERGRAFDFPLALVFWENDAHIEGFAWYRCSAFASGRVEQSLRDLLHLASYVASHPDARLSELHGHRI